MKVAFYTLGCKVNQYETELMRESLLDAGFEVVSPDDDADVYIVNSCTVTSVSNQKTRQCLRAFKRAHPDCITVLAGCMSQAYPAEAQALEQADIIIGNTEHKHLAGLIERCLHEKSRIIEVSAHQSAECFESGIIRTFAGKTRAEVKIEDGCNRFCSYCAIPYARGRVRSKPLAQLQEELTTLAQNGYREIVLVGINLSAYDDGGKNIADAVTLACGIEGIERVRLGSLEPDHITDAIIDKLASTEKFCPQFHISLQSGCDKTLKAMNRHYTADEYRRLAQKLRSSFRDCTLTTDIMTGFPGESEEDFLCSYRFAQEIGFEKMHVFPYSVREGTAAAKFAGQVPKAVKSARAKQMIALANQMRISFFKQQVGKSVSVLFETKKGNINCGYTKNYTPVIVKTDDDLQDRILSVRITDYTNEACIGDPE